MSLSDVSVVIPTFNGGRFIEQTLASVLGQSSPPLEVIVVDDNSSDDTLEIVERVAQHSTVAIQLVRLDTNSGGPARPMNIGIERSRGDFIAMLDQDDLMADNRLFNSKVASKEYPEASLILGNYVHFDGNGFLDGALCSSFYREIAGLDFQGEPPMVFLDAVHWRRRFFMDPGIQRSCSNHFFRKAIWKAVGGYREKAKFCSDYDFVIRAFGAGVVWLKERAFVKRLHDDNACQDTVEQWLQTVAVQQDIAALVQSDELRKAAEEITRQAAQRLRWTSHYKESRGQALQLFRYGRWSEAAKEFFKTTAVACCKP